MKRPLSVLLSFFMIFNFCLSSLAGQHNTLADFFKTSAEFSDKKKSGNRITDSFMTEKSFPDHSAVSLLRYIPFPERIERTITENDPIRGL